MGLSWRSMVCLPDASLADVSLVRVSLAVFCLAACRAVLAVLRLLLRPCLRLLFFQQRRLLIGRTVSFV